MREPQLYGAVPGDVGYLRALGELETEASMLWRLRHPNIVACGGLVVDTVSSEPRGILLELAHDTLLGYVRAFTGSSGRITLSFLKALCTDVLTALVYLHSFGAHGVIHRDLKPDNILVFMLTDELERSVLDSPPRLRFKLGDLGVARDMDTILSAQGAPAYKAPEMATGKSFDARADVFSFGTVLVELLTVYCPELASPGEPEYAGFSLTGRQEAIGHAVTRATKLSPALAQLLNKCCQDNPDNRVTAAGALELASEIDAEPAAAPSLSQLKLMEVCTLTLHGFERQPLHLMCGCHSVLLQATQTVEAAGLQIQRLTVDLAASGETISSLRTSQVRWSLCVCSVNGPCVLCVLRCACGLLLCSFRAVGARGTAGCSACAVACRTLCRRRYFALPLAHPCLTPLFAPCGNCCRAVLAASGGRWCPRYCCGVPGLAQRAWCQCVLAVALCNPVPVVHNK